MSVLQPGLHGAGSLVPVLSAMVSSLSTGQCSVGPLHDVVAVLASHLHDQLRHVVGVVEILTQGHSKSILN
jgi:hypothetical protein